MTMTQATAVGQSSLPRTLTPLIAWRSMTPNTTAHAMTHLFGDPSAILGILIGAAHNLPE